MKSQKNTTWSYEATVYLGLGEYDKALDLYDKSYAERNWAMIWFKIGHNLKPLHGMPRYEALLKKMNFPEGVPSANNGGAFRGLKGNASVGVESN